MTDYFMLGQYVRRGYRAWFNQNGGPVGDRRTIDQLEADYRASQCPAQHTTDPRPPIIKPPQGGPVTGRVKGRTTKREWRGEAKS